jgi:hypothetical protein
MQSSSINRFFGLFLISGLFCTAACGSPQSSTAEPASDPCYDADIAAKRVWNEETRVHVKAQVMEWGGELGVDVATQKAEEITNSMDRLADDWARMRKAVCNDHFKRATITKEEYQSRADCLDELLTRQRNFLSSLSSPQVDVGAQLAQINGALEECR